MAAQFRDRAFYVIIVVLFASLYFLRNLTKPKRLEQGSFTLPDVRRHLHYQLPPEIEELKASGVDLQKALSFADSDAVPDGSSRQSQKQTKKAKQLAAEVAAVRRLVSNSQKPLGEKYSSLFWRCQTGNPTDTEVFETFVSLRHRIFEIKINSDKYEGAYNPTVIALPPSSHYPFLIVARVRGPGYVQASLICEGKYVDERIVNGYGIEVTVKHLGCQTNPRELAVPQTPARDCSGVDFMADVPGYHDPRLFWSMDGQPLMMLNQQSRYGCFGLWMIDLRSIYPPLRYKVTRGLLNEYPSVMEITRTENRGLVEKNYQVFYDSNTAAPYVQYELSHGSRYFARLIGNGLTTSNMTSPLERTCIREDATWHQATNPVKVILCSYGLCEPSTENTVYLAFVHKKESSGKFKVQYKRYLAVWKSVAPFEMIAFGSKHIRFDNEDEWEQKFDVEGKFLYTVSIAWEKYQNRYEGYLNERLLISLGVGDHATAAVSVPVNDLLTCMYSCGN